ncbi:MAG: hypothetical protein ACREOF_01595, partial [Gemmatimonadales bacterium]
ALMLFCSSALLVLACGGDTGPNGPGPRTYRMGFSGIPPRPDQSAVLPTVDQWVSRADVAVRALHLDRVEHYRSRGLAVVVTLDATDGLDRAAEAPSWLPWGGASPGRPSSRHIGITPSPSRPSSLPTTWAWPPKPI